MEPLIIGATDESPGINFDKEIGKFLIFGKSFPEEARRFFDPVFLWITEYVKTPNEETRFEFRLEYYNSATATMLLEVLYTLERIVNEEGKKATIVWYYLEIDDDMLEAGREYAEIVNIPFEFNIIEDY